MQPRLADILNEEDIVLSRRATAFNGYGPPLLANSIPFDTALRGLSFSIFDGSIMDIKPVTSESPRANRIDVALGEAIIKVDIFEGNDGLAVKVKCHHVSLKPPVTRAVDMYQQESRSVVWRLQKRKPIEIV